MVPIIFYRALLLAGDTAPIDALADALAARGLAPAPLMVTSLKEADAAAFVTQALRRLDPAVIVTTTAFAAGGDPGEPTPLDGPDVPVLQAVIATTKRAAWCESPRGLGAADLAMHVVLPELDGRVLVGAVAFKHPAPAHAGLAFTALGERPEPDRVAMVAARVAALVRLRQTPRAARRIAVLMPDYPGAPGRTGYAVGLDVPASVVALLADLEAAGYAVADAPTSSRGAARFVESRHLRRGAHARSLCNNFCADLPAEIATRITDAWGSRRMIRTCAMAPSGSTPAVSAMSSSRCRPTAGARRSAARTITIRPRRRATPSWRSGSGCNMSPGATRWCIWARTARSNGCRARRWRSRPPAFRRRRWGRCR